MSALATTEHQDQTNCGPLSWKQENNIKINYESDSYSDNDISPLKLVRNCKPSCWAYGHTILLACKGKIKDIVVNKHTCYGENETITGYWHYLVMNFYNHENILQPCHVTIYIDGETNISGDPSEYALRNPKCIRKKEFVDEDTIKTLLEQYH